MQPLIVGHNERVPQQLAGGPPPDGLALQAARDEVPELRGSGGGGLGGIGHADGAHEAGPVALAADGEGEAPQVELEDADAEAPDVAGVTVVLAVVEVGVDALGAHVGDGADGGVAGVHGLGEDAADAEVGDLDLLPRVHEEVRGLDVAVDDFPAVEVGEAAQDLARQVAEVVLVADVDALQRPAVHELQQHLDLAAVVVHVVALHHVRVVHVPQDLDLPADLAPHRLLVVAVDHLQRVRPPRRPVDHLVDRPAAPATDPIHPLQLREVNLLLLRRRRRRRRRLREDAVEVVADGVAGAGAPVVEVAGGRRRAGGREGEGDGEGRVALWERQREVRTPAGPVAPGGRGRGRGRIGGGAGRWRLNRPHGSPPNLNLSLLSSLLSLSLFPESASDSCSWVFRPSSEIAHERGKAP
ncbi:hypothetical protein EUGRSUZ_F03995 [Eucalyptus grandis]|uniref:Uncharacterized protein n=2 Tax=Eucalyptus grandis TaxID=71139 RepID=A0ACC3KNV9_EUCGR|nr:hypothetical protein EUGRSUZ_F03995 [Eucalyptus grandis]